MPYDYDPPSPLEKLLYAEACEVEAVGVARNDPDYFDFSIVDFEENALAKHILAGCSTGDKEAILRITRDISEGWSARRWVNIGKKIKAMIDLEFAEAGGSA